MYILTLGESVLNIQMCLGNRVTYKWQVLCMRKVTVLAWFSMCSV